MSGVCSLGPTLCVVLFLFLVVNFGHSKHKTSLVLLYHKVNCWGKFRMLWRVVHFINDDSVEAVPDLWIIKESNQCYWPSLNGAKLKNLIAKCESPCDDWETFPIRMIGGAYDNLLTARYKAIKAETSDLNSDFEQNKRIRKKNTLLSSSGSDSEEEMNHMKQMPVLQQNSTQKRKGVNSSTGSLKNHLVNVTVSSDASSSHQIGSQNAYVNSLLSQNTNTSHIGIVADGDDDDVSIRSSIEVRNLASTTSKQKESSNVYHEENFRRQVFRQLNVLSIKLDQLTGDIANIHLFKKQDEDPVQEYILDGFQLPLKTQEELNVFDDFLQNKENVSKVVKELSIIGGSNYKVMVKRLMSRLIHDELAMLYSINTNKISPH